MFYQSINVKIDGVKMFSINIYRLKRDDIYPWPGWFKSKRN